MPEVDLRLPDYEAMRHYPSWTDPLGQLMRPGDLGFWPVAYGSSYRIKFGMVKALQRTNAKGEPYLDREYVNDPEYVDVHGRNTQRRPVDVPSVKMSMYGLGTTSPPGRLHVSVSNGVTSVSAGRVCKYHLTVDQFLDTLGVMDDDRYTIVR